MIIVHAPEAAFDMEARREIVDSEAKMRLIEGATTIFGRRLGTSDLMPIYIIIHEVPEENWGIFGQKADLAAFRTSPIDAAAL